MFRDRVDAGRQLADLLAHRAGDDAVVVGLPRGGVPVAAEIAGALDVPLDVILVRKLGVPFQPELGMGAIGDGDVRVVNDEIIRAARVGDDDFAAVEARERAELDRRARRFRSGRARVPLAGRIVIVVDDGIATGSTARAACTVARAAGAREVVLATPVAPTDWTRRLAGCADEFVCVSTPDHFTAIGQCYRDFTQVGDAEVVAHLDAAADRFVADARSAGAPRRPATPPEQRDDDILLDLDERQLGGHLTLPSRARGLVVFAHGSGSSRHSPRNRFVATVLHDAGLGTFLFDLLTAAEERDRANVFDIELLGGRLGEVTGLLRREPGLADLPVAYFGASTGAAAALAAAADPASSVVAVVSRGGRPDLAGRHLGAVRAPTLLIVGGEDHPVLDLNEQARSQLRCEHALSVVPGATHLFAEPGTLRIAAELARDWIVRHLVVSGDETGS
ncbi:MAG: phosphoribosyltransferase [Actinomycetota bacterium]